MKDYIYAKAEALARRLGTRDPMEALEALGVVTVMTDRYPKCGMKGYCAVINRIKYVVLNSKMRPQECTVTAAHELGHIVLHGAELAGAGMLADKYLAMNGGRLEREADMFAADFLLDDARVTECILSADADFFNVARMLRIPREFLAFKMYSMVQRGVGGEANIPIELSTDFLASERRK